MATAKKTAIWLMEMSGIQSHRRNPVIRRDYQKEKGL